MGFRKHAAESRVRAISLMLSFCLHSNALNSLVFLGHHSKPQVVFASGLKFYSDALYFGFNSRWCCCYCFPVHVCPSFCLWGKPPDRKTTSNPEDGGLEFTSESVSTAEAEKLDSWPSLPPFQMNSFSFLSCRLRRWSNKPWLTCANFTER